MKKLFKLLSVTLSAACLLSFSACSLFIPEETPSHTEHTYFQTYSTDETYHWYAPSCNDTTELKDKEKHSFNGLYCTVCNYERQATLQQFTTDYIDTAKSFFNAKLRGQIVGDKQVLSQSAYLEANAGNQLTGATLVYIYKTEVATRTLEVATASFAAINLNSIIKDYSSLSVQAEIDRTTVFEFDTEENYNKQNVATALYDAINNKSKTKLFNEVEASKNRDRAFDIISLTDNNLSVYNIEVTKGNGSDEALLESLTNPFEYNFSKKATYDLNGTNIIADEYELENVGGDVNEPTEPTEPSEPEKPSVTDAELIEALNENCKLEVASACFPSSYTVNINNISNGAWYVTKDDDKKLTKIEYCFNYTADNGDAYFAIGTMNFASPTSIEDIKDGKVTNASYSRAYRFSYDASIQENRVDLTNAICNKLFGENTSAIRYIVDKGAKVDNKLESTAREFIVLEITDDGVNEITIRIKNASSDVNYITNLNSESNYYTANKNSYEISGTLLTVEK